MNIATRTKNLAQKTSVLIRNLACCALVTGGLTGMSNDVQAGTVTDAVASAAQPGVAYNWFRPATFSTSNITPTPGPSTEQSVSIVEASGLSARMIRVRDWVADRYKVSADSLNEALAAAEDEGRAKGIDPLLIVAIMAVESSFNPRAASPVGALGLMQVIPRFHWDKVDGQKNRKVFFDPEINVRAGTRVLHEGLSRYGTLQRALQYYNGSLGDRTLRYSRKVMTMKRELASVARI